MTLEHTNVDSDDQREHDQDHDQTRHVVDVVVINVAWLPSDS
jgi:hypothetical protein